ncbi:MAG: heterodisulfide reductase-related iron-sulfur binding cluster, partial [Xanthobacteraceae bacterium]
MSFETALDARVGQMVDACTRCGKCVQACPSVAPAGLADAKPEDVIGGIIDILRTGNGPDVSRKWASSCMLSGECITACDEDVNPRFLLAMARIAMTKATHELPSRRRQGIDAFRNLGRDVSVLSRLQLDGEVLERLGQGAARGGGPEDAAPDFVFYTGCNVLKTPHIALLALDIMDALGVTYRVMGGPSHCCGVQHMRAGDTEVLGRMATSTLDKLSQSKSGQVISWCPSCYVQFTETTLPTIERQRGTRPFEMTPFMLFLASRLEQLRPLLQTRLAMRVALHRHPGVAGVIAAAETLLRAVPGVELVDLGQPAVGLQSVNLSVLPAYKREVQLKELEAARAAGVDALAAVYHSDHRELCAHERDWPFRIVNVLEIIGESMGVHEPDRYKRLKIMQDADAIIADCRDLIAQHGLDAEVARNVVIKGMLADQPLPLAGAKA